MPQQSPTVAGAPVPLRPFVAVLAGRGAEVVRCSGWLPLSS
ncbi:hypothetical protein [Kineococcus sp. R86509]